MTGTFGEVFGPRNQTGSEPRPARKQVPKITISPRGSNRVKKGAVDPRDARFQPLFSSGTHKFQYFLMNPFLYDE